MNDTPKWLDAIGFIVLTASIAYGAWSFAKLDARLDRLAEQQNVQAER